MTHHPIWRLPQTLMQMLRWKTERRRGWRVLRSSMTLSRSCRTIEWNCHKSDRSEDVSEKSQRSEKVETGSYSHVETKVQDESAGGIKSCALQRPSVQPEGQLAGHLQQRNELPELEKKRQRLRLLETFRGLENPMLSGLCGTLFPSNPGSVWNGANSLVRRQKLPHHRRSGIHQAIASFMTPSCKSSSSLK